MSLTYGELQSVWLSAATGTKYATSTWAHLMAAIALAESGGNPTALNSTDNGGTQSSWGLWQISLGNHNAPAPNWSDPIENAKLAIGKLDTQGVTAWGTYDSGLYKQYMTGAGPTPVPPGAGGSGGGATTDSANPLSWKLDGIPLFGWAGKLITGTTGGLQGIASLADIATGIAGLVRTLNKMIQLSLMLFSPPFWLRVGTFFAGIAALAGAVYFFGKAL